MPGRVQAPCDDKLLATAFLPDPQFTLGITRRLSRTHVAQPPAPAGIEPGDFGDAASAVTAALGPLIVLLWAPVCRWACEPLFLSQQLGRR